MFNTIKRQMFGGVGDGLTDKERRMVNILTGVTVVTVTIISAAISIHRNMENKEIEKKCNQIACDPGLKNQIFNNECICYKIAGE